MDPFGFDNFNPHRNESQLEKGLGFATPVIGRRSNSDLIPESLIRGGKSGRHGNILT